MENLTLTDNAISHVAKLVQVAILTGTDIVDNLRMAEFINNDGQIDISPEYHESFNENINRMMEEAATAATQPEAQEYVTIDIPPEAIVGIKLESGDGEG